MSFRSFFHNVWTVAIITLLTFVVLDINKAPTYEQTYTNQYLTKIGVAPHLNRVLAAINNNQVYRQHIHPACQKFLKSAEEFRKHVSFNLVKAGKMVKKCAVDFVDFLDQHVYPKLKNMTNCAVKAFQKHVQPLLTSAKDKLLNFIDSLEHNEFYNQLSVGLVNLILDARKQVLTAAEWVSNRFEQLLS